MAVSKFLLPLLLLVMTFLAFTPYLDAGFFADDAMNSQVNLVAEKENISVFQFTKKINSNWMNEVGRFFPLGFLGSYFFYSFFPKEIIARSVQMFLVFLNIIIFSLVIRKLSGSKRMAILFIPVILLHFQIRDFYDPIAGYAPFMQMMFFYVLGNIILFWYVLNGAGLLHLLLSGLLFAASLMTYELSLVFFGILVLLSWEKERSFYRALYQLRLHILLLVGYLFIILYLRTYRTSLYQGTEMALNLNTALQAYIHQLGSSIPLSHFTFNKYFTLEKLTVAGQNIIIATGYALTTLLCLWAGYTIKSNEIHSKEKRSLTLIGLGFLFLPPLVVAFSARWQISVSPGMGYIPVYFCYFGSALFITYLLNSLCNLPFRRAKYLLLFMTIGLVLISFLNHLVNQLAVEHQNQSFKYPRQEVEEAYNSGILNDIPTGSIILTPKSYSWNTIFLTKETVKKIDSIISIEDFRKISNTNSNGKIYYLDFKNTLNREDLSKWVLLSKISTTSKSKVAIASKPPIEFTKSLIYASSEASDKSKLIISCLNNDKPLNLKVEALGRLYSISQLSCSPDELKLHFE